MRIRKYFFNKFTQGRRYTKRQTIHLLIYIYSNCIHTIPDYSTKLLIFLPNFKSYRVQEGFLKSQQTIQIFDNQVIINNYSNSNTVFSYSLKVIVAQSINIFSNVALLLDANPNFRSPSFPGLIS